MSEIAADVREGPLALAVGADLQVLTRFMADDVTEPCRSKARHNPDRRRPAMPAALVG